jgi:hypothetical protein
MIKRKKGVEIDEIHLYNTFWHFWLKGVFGPKSCEF